MDRATFDSTIRAFTESRVSKDTGWRAARLVPAGINRAARLDCAIRKAGLSRLADIVWESPVSSGMGDPSERRNRENRGKSAGTLCGMTSASMK